MMRNWRFLLYGVLGAALLMAALAAPAVWATAGNNGLTQTIPTRTPTSGPVPPTEPPPNTVQPGPPPGATDVPGATPAPRATAAPAGATPGPACATATTLTLVADRTAVWPGATVVFTATLTNTSRAPLRQIVLEDQLAAGLEPLAVLSNNGTWQARSLRITAASLEPAAKLVAVYSAKVAAQRPGDAIIARAFSTTAGCPRKAATLTLGLPPSELPATGGAWR